MRHQLFNMMAGIAVTMLVGFVAFVWLIESDQPWTGLGNVAVQADAQGVIHHPLYGDYPAETEFHQGMTLMPGQRAHVGMEIHTGPAGTCKVPPGGDTTGLICDENGVIVVGEKGYPGRVCFESATDTWTDCDNGQVLRVADPKKLSMLRCWDGERDEKGNPTWRRCQQRLE